MLEADVIIIGGGIFGCVIAKQLEAQGKTTLIIDSNENYSGSKPAACLMKPSWCSSMGKENYKIALDTLSNLYDVKTIEFETKVGIAKVPKTKAQWINPREILSPGSNAIIAKVLWVEKKGKSWQVETNFETYSGKYVILAAGIWCNDILVNSKLDMATNLTAMTGASFTAKGKITPRILLYRPYKQISYFNIEEDLIWVGDGVANKNYTTAHLYESRMRCGNAINNHELIATIGHRPYVKGATPCYLAEHAPRLWVVTGGAKNGTIAAGWAANQLGKEII